MIKKGLLLFLLILFLAGCQSTDTESPEEEKTLDEKPEITITQGDKSINTDTIVNCWADNDCSEESGKIENINMEELTEDIEPNEITNDERLSLNIEGMEPTQWGYTVYDPDKGSYKDGTLKNNKIDINGDGEKQYLITGSWYDDGKFIGTISKVFVLEIE
ncbi:hypothetical protein [Lentibacillus jeotgali]|uniref:hypothetical protein n=1 Tax=Lentibacillus jeotgali TaxID=558169 RepID=UPI000262782E|nr:hypothetical protein [Lentibacillus jeotgali]